MSLVYCFDLDGTICTLSKDNDYTLALPIDGMVDAVNHLYDSGNTIKIFTARGATSKKDWSLVTQKQLSDWGLKHHELIMNQKPSFDIMIDDKAINAEDWRTKNLNIKGVIAGSFDVIHPGYIKMFKDAKNYCNHLTICLHENPSLYNSKKIPTILSIEERKEILLSIKYIDNIIEYKTENELSEILKKNRFDVRVIGSDYIDKPITGSEYTNKVVYHERNHNWSTTEYKRKIYESFSNRT
jgi:glycerol-3-phosphate cytidylyltransferase